MKANAVQLNLSKVYKPLKNVYGSEKRPFSITGITKVSFEKYDLNEQKKSIETYLGRPLPDFNTDSKGQTPLNVVFTSPTMRVVVDFGKLLRDDVNNTIAQCMVTDTKTGKKFYQIDSVSYDGNICVFSNNSSETDVEEDQEDGDAF